MHTVVRAGTILCMDEISSTEFRKRYASLREPVAVTVNGHRIGVWSPVTPWTALEADPDFNRRLEIGKAQLAAGQRVPFRSRPFTPVPKK